MSLWSCIAKIFIHIKPKHLNNALGGPKLLSIVSKGYTLGLIYVGGRVGTGLGPMGSGSDFEPGFK